MNEIHNERQDNVLLSVNDLYVNYTSDGKVIEAVNGVSLKVERGKTLGLVGETGAGKTTIAKAILGVLPDPPAYIKSGEIVFNGQDLLKLSQAEMRKIRGYKISMIFQDPMTALNPVMRVGRQVSEAIAVHEHLSRHDADESAMQILEMVGITRDRFREYPHQFSGGMKQRVIIAMALACNPDLLLADEPTTALDVTIQAQVLEMMNDLKVQKNTALILITHDLGIVAESCDDVAVIYAGEIVEYGSLEDIFDRAVHPYTIGLFGAIPRLDNETERLRPIDGQPPDPSNLPAGCSFSPRCPYATQICREKKPAAADLGESMSAVAGISAISPRREIDMSNVVEIKGLKKYFKTARGMVHAVDDIDMPFEEGTTMGVVGESGCGKSTLGRTIIHLQESSGGQIFYKGQDVTYVKRKQLGELRKHMQIIFQDPYSSLNPRRTVAETIAEPLRLANKLQGPSLEKEINRIMDLVGIAKRFRMAYPHEMDGGRRQRVGIGRALAVNPEFIVCDEPVSALDVSIQAQILNLLLDLQKEYNLTYMFVTHDLSVVKHISDNISVMYLGQLVETSAANELFSKPLHPYTKALLSAIPSVDIHNRQKRIILKGELVSPIDPKPGCRFMARCPYACEDCGRPQHLREISPGHFVSCGQVEKINGMESVQGVRKE